MASTAAISAGLNPLFAAISGENLYKDKKKILTKQKCHFGGRKHIVSYSTASKICKRAWRPPPIRKVTYGGKRKKCIYFSFLLQAEIFTPHSLNHLRGKWRTSRSLWNEESEYKWGKTDWGVDQDLLASLEGKEPHIHCTCCALPVYKLYIMFTREKSDCFVIIF